MQLNVVVLSILAVKIWTLYCQFMMDIMEGQHSIEGVRSTFEKAIIATGLHVTEVCTVYSNIPALLSFSFRSLCYSILWTKLNGQPVFFFVIMIIFPYSSFHYYWQYDFSLHYKWYSSAYNNNHYHIIYSHLHYHNLLILYLNINSCYNLSLHAGMFR